MGHRVLHMTVLFLWLFAHRAGAQDERLSYDLRTGERYRLKIEIQQSTYSESLRIDEISLYSVTGIDFRVDSIGTGGSIHMTAGYSGLLLSMLAPSLQIDINSNRSGDGRLSEMVHALEEQPFGVVMDPSGEMRSLEGIGELFRFPEFSDAEDSLEISVIRTTLDEVYGAEAFSSLFGLFLSIYPVVQPIPNWTRDITYYFNTKPVRISNRYFLSRITDLRITIQGMGMLEQESPVREQDGEREVTSVVSGSQTYDIQVDRQSGWPLEGLSRQRILIESTVVRDPVLPKGLRIPSYTETVFEIKGSKL